KLARKIVFPKTYSPSLIRKCHNVGRKVKPVLREVDRVIIIIDKENINTYSEEKDVWRHLLNLRKEDRDKIVVVATEPELGNRYAYP
ncbi:MAG: hypothetical protein DRJ41_01035, partial [Thermoprotei archaeon]